MKREDLTHSVAQANHQSPAEARDQIDELVHKILTALQRGEPVELPGVGTLVNTTPKRVRRVKP
jgi:nucleoid DNA-binding protein